jgi:hypothetical protein
VIIIFCSLCQSVGSLPNERIVSCKGTFHCCFCRQATKKLNNQTTLIVWHLQQILFMVVLTRLSARRSSLGTKANIENKKSKEETRIRGKEPSSSIKSAAAPQKTSGNEEATASLKTINCRSPNLSRANQVLLLHRILEQGGPQLASLSRIIESDPEQRFGTSDRSCPIRRASYSKFRVWKRYSVESLKKHLESDQIKVEKGKLTNRKTNTAASDLFAPAVVPELEIQIE